MRARTDVILGWPLCLSFYVGALKIVLAIVRGGSPSAAARTLGVNQTTVSRRLATLEESLGEDDLIPCFLSRKGRGFPLNRCAFNKFSTFSMVCRGAHTNTRQSLAI